ncbi:MAG: hypothetical protein WBN15_21240, partial [Polyangiales bacterium]
NPRSVGRLALGNTGSRSKSDRQSPMPYCGSLVLSAITKYMLYACHPVLLSSTVTSRSGSQL